MVLDDVHLAPGKLAAQPNRVGVATFASTQGICAKSLLLHSIENSVVKEFQRSELGRAPIGSETRVYIISKSGWRVDRVKRFDPIRHPFIEIPARGGGKTQCLHDWRWAALGSGLRAAAKDLARSQRRLTNELRDRVGDGACL
jgi:hypothetical protein